MHKGSFGFTVAPASTPLNNRKISVLRLLGRLEFMLSSQLRNMVYRDLSRSLMFKELNALIGEDLVWCTKSPYSAVTTTTREGRYAPPMQQPRVYGLTNVGKSVLESLEVEPDQRTLDGLKARDPRGRPVSSLTLSHDLQASWFCSNVLEAARRSRYVKSVYIQMEYVSHADQRMDALIILRLSRKRVERDLNKYPLFDGSPMGADEYELRFALEVDRDTEQLKTLVAKGETYRNLTANNTYQRALGGLVMPVFLVPTSRRAAQIARGWRKIWPEGWGIISTPFTADDRQLGVLWGTYLGLIDQKPCSLMTMLVQHPQTQHVELVEPMVRSEWIADLEESGQMYTPAERKGKQNSETAAVCAE